MGGVTHGVTVFLFLLHCRLATYFRGSLSTIALLSERRDRANIKASWGVFKAVSSKLSKTNPFTPLSSPHMHAYTKQMFATNCLQMVAHNLANAFIYTSPSIFQENYYNSLAVNLCPEVRKKTEYVRIGIFYEDGQKMRGWPEGCRGVDSIFLKVLYTRRNWKALAFSWKAKAFSKL